MESFWVTVVYPWLAAMGALVAFVIFTGSTRRGAGGTAARASDAKNRHDRADAPPATRDLSRPTECTDRCRSAMPAAAGKTASLTGL